MKVEAGLLLSALFAGAAGHAIMTNLVLAMPLQFLAMTGYKIILPSPATFSVRQSPLIKILPLAQYDVTSNCIACNGGDNLTTASDKVITVTAEDIVQGVWRHTLTRERICDGSDVINSSHLGPVMTYMKKVEDATSAIGYGSGKKATTQAVCFHSLPSRHPQPHKPSTTTTITTNTHLPADTWAVTELIAAEGLQNITIPACIENG
ncbi:MAG: hypothetical protein M1834_001130 [Cirrosporium novae-zelandiae]|nr:MAG: hypothetical protein M1834_001130 [Cirrosporium novae-zelandiae]